MTRPMSLLIAAMLSVAVCLTGIVVLLLSGNSSLLPALSWLPPPWIGLVLIGIATVAEIVYVPLDHDGETEQLGLLEAAVVVSVLLLPPVTALWVCGAGFALATAVRRVQLVKSVYNVAMHVAAMSALILVVRSLSSPDSGFSLRLIIALLAGTAVFVTLNLLGVGIAMQTTSSMTLARLVRSQWRMSALMAVATVSVGATAVSLAQHSALLLPTIALPAGALTYAYRTRAAQADERRQTSQLFTLSEVLAGRYDPDELLSTFVTTASDAFRADDAVVVLLPVDRDDASDLERSVRAVALHPDGAPYDTRQLATRQQIALLDLVGQGPTARLVTTGLPPGWKRAVVAPLQAGGGRLGAVVLGWQRHPSDASERAVAMLTPIASALAFALRGAEALHRLVTESTKLQAVVDQSSDGILVLDGTGVIEVWSPAMAVLTGLAAEHVLGQPLGAVVPCRTTEGTRADFFGVGREQLTPANPRTTVEVAVIRTDEDQRWTRCAHAGVFEDGRLVRDVVIVHDVTRERRVDRLKADFIATVSHELRTPVTPIKGYAELLWTRGDRMSPDKREECLDFIIERAGHLANLVEDLLLTSRISDGEQGPERRVRMVDSDLADVVRRAVGDVNAERVTLQGADLPVPVVCDPLRTRQVVTNLVSNAVRYSGADTVVSVLVSGDDQTCVVAVRDRGRGIPADELEAIFEKFHRVEDPMRMTTSGTGLGLFIAQQLAQAMGGRIDVRSTLGVGSTFRLVLPRHHRTSATGPEQAGPGRPAVGPLPRTDPAADASVPA